MILRCAFASFILLSCTLSAKLVLLRFVGEPITDGMLANV